MTASNSITSSRAPPSHRAKIGGQGGTRFWWGRFVKAKIGELEEEVRAVSSRRMSKELTGAVQGVSGRRSFSARFQNGCKNNLSYRIESLS